MLPLNKIKGDLNPADLMTKNVPVEKVKLFCALLMLMFDEGRAKSAAQIHNLKGAGDEVDGWSATGERRVWIRDHNAWRRDLFTPYGVCNGPSSDTKFKSNRVTTGRTRDGQRFQITDCWTDAHAAHRQLEFEWQGTTAFEQKYSNGRPTGHIMEVLNSVVCQPVANARLVGSCIRVARREVHNFIGILDKDEMKPEYDPFAEYNDDIEYHKSLGEIDCQGETEAADREAIFPARERAQYEDCAKEDQDQFQRGGRWHRPCCVQEHPGGGGQEEDGLIASGGGVGGLRPRRVITSHRATGVIPRCSVRGSTEGEVPRHRYDWTIAEPRKGYYDSGVPLSCWLKSRFPRDVDYNFGALVKERATPSPANDLVW